MLENLKQQLISIAQTAEKDGLCRYKSGNFSIKCNENKVILITPSGIDRKYLTAKQICVLDLEGNIIECQKGLKPSSEYLMHIEAYKCRKAIQAIVHTHSKIATSFSVLNREIPLIVSEAKYIFEYDGYIRVAPYEEPGSVALSKSILNVINKYNVCLLANHGVLAVSEKSIEDALLKAQYIEEVANIYYHVLMINNGKEPAKLGEKID